jgi:hypothetical protein
MNVVIRCSINGDEAPLGLRAADWLAAFHPDVAVAVEGGTASLSAPGRDEAQLRLIWLTGLCNERLLARGARARAAVLDQLTR